MCSKMRQKLTEDNPRLAEALLLAELLSATTLDLPEFVLDLAALPYTLLVGEVAWPNHG